MAAGEKLVRGLTPLLNRVWLFNSLCFLIPVVIIQICNPTVELVIPIGMPTKEGKAEMETHPVIIEPKIRNC